MASDQTKYPSKNPITPLRPTIGLLLATLHTGASVTLWPAIADEARRRKANLICFPGGRLGDGPEADPERNRVYELAGSGCLDGLITWASSIGGAVAPPLVEAFHQRYRDLPMLSLSNRLEGLPVIRVDAYSGMRQLIDHLVTVHGYRRIAFLRGPGEHQSAQARYQAYVDCLAAHGLDLDPSLIVGPIAWDAGKEAIRILLDERGLIPGRDFAALASASDMLSFGAHSSLLARGYRIPQDIAVTGFNGTTESLLSQPPMTTVHMPFVEQGEAAVASLLGMMQSGETAADVNLPSRLVIRESCGCQSRSASLAGRMIHAGSGTDKPTEDALRQDWLNQLALLGDFGTDRVEAWFRPLFDAFLQDLETADAPGSSRASTPRSLEFLGKAMERGASGLAGLADPDLAAWQDVVSLMRSVLWPWLPEAGRDRLDSLLDACRVRISEFIQRQATFRLWDSKRRSETLREVGRSLLAAWNVADLADALARSLGALEVDGAWLVLCEEPGAMRPSAPVEQACLVMAHQAGQRIELPRGGLPFALAELLPAAFLPEGDPWCLVVEPLYFQDRTVGYAIFQAGTWDGAVYEELRGYLSSALKGVFLFAEAAHARQVAEKADQIKTRLLANVSHELRTPLTQILGHVETATKMDGSAADHAAIGSELKRIRLSAEHQLRVVNDLLDLSRAEIDELDLSRELIDPAALLAGVFADFAPANPGDGPLAWRLAMPERLPLIQADPLRLRQVVINLVANAAKFTSSGVIELGAEIETSQLHVWVRDTGAGIAPELQERIFQPFVTGDHEHSGGIGLGLSIARHMVALHFGSLELESQPGAGSTFHVRLPLPNLEDSLLTGSEQRQALMIRIARQSTVAPELVEFARRRGLEILTLGLEGTEDPPLDNLNPACLCWDLAEAQPRDWALVRRLRHHPGLFQAPFILYGQAPRGAELQLGLTGILPKHQGSQNLAQAIEAACPRDGTNPVYVVDDEEPSRNAVRQVLEQSLPGYPLRLFADGEAALTAMTNEIPGLVILDYAMPGIDGAAVLDRMRSDPRLRLVPVLMLSNKVFSQDDIKRIEGHARVTLQSKGVWDDGETADALNRLLYGGEGVPVHTSALVKRALAYITRHYHQALTRWQLAEAVNVSEDYLSRVFTRELGLSPWDYLNRFRIHQACRLLVASNDSIRSIACTVGFNDQAYFSRVFRKMMACTPQEFRTKS